MADWPRNRCPTCSWEFTDEELAALAFPCRCPRCNYAIEDRNELIGE